jgi:hypothetical protein
VALLLLGLSLFAPVSPAGAEDGTSDWPFAKLKRPSLPAVRQRSWVRNPIDAFVLARLEQAGLQPNSPADKLTLLRRVTFDLTGLAPTQAERIAFLTDYSPDAYERLVDRLLASPRFGERWAQHWLDIVRYADTEGFKLDRLRTEAYRYRDYVIRAFNTDLPYDRFLRQQVAGDELEPNNPDALVATGLFRLHPEESNGSNYRLIRQTILDDITDVFGSAVLGMTFSCARCHDHKFDPITQKDYYSLQAFFAGVIHRDDLCLASSEEQAQAARQRAAWEKATREIQAERDALVAPIRRDLFEEIIVTFDPDTQKALRTPESERTPLQQQLACLSFKQIGRRYARAYRRLPADKRARYDALGKKLEAFQALEPATLPVAMAVSDTGAQTPVTHCLAVGNYLKPREEVAPAFPEFLDTQTPNIRPVSGERPSSGRRSALAHWLSRSDNPMTSRVIVNRLWQHYLGQGIVGTPNDFGTMGEKATHPELLDYLATELVRQGWGLKAVHRLIVTSATYRQSSAAEQNRLATTANRVDAENKLLWHARVKRREAEAIRDAVLQASGQLNLRMFGPGVRPELPAPMMENTYAWDPDEKQEDRNRRSIYMLAKRNFDYPLFAAFDVPDRSESCPVRATTITAPQALAMLNGEFALGQARYMAADLLTRQGNDVRWVIRQAYLRTFLREPVPEEMQAAVQFLKHQSRLASRGAKTENPLGPAGAPAGIDSSFAQAVVDFCHALLNAAEFLDIE